MDRPGTPRLAGIVNLSPDSFSELGRHEDPAAALAQARRLVADGADLIDVGAASSRPGAVGVEPAEEIRRLEPVVAPLAREGVVVSVDTFAPETQRWALRQGVGWLNDIQGFPEPALYPELARADCRLVVMHSVQRLGPATRVDTDAETVWEDLLGFFERRVEALVQAGVARERIVLDPGMGFFLGRTIEPSLLVLRRLGALRARFGLPVWIGVSRKHFLGTLTGRPVPERGAATLAAELWAARAGVDYIRTHDVRALHDALLVDAALAADPSR